MNAAVIKPVPAVPTGPAATHLNQPGPNPFGRCFDDPAHGVLGLGLGNEPVAYKGQGLLRRFGQGGEFLFKVRQQHFPDAVREGPDKPQ